MDINVVAENLAELLTNSVNMTQVYYDLFFNPEPMDITLYQYDDNRLVAVVIPNRAKDKIRLEEIAAELATKISSTEKGQPEGVATLDEGGKVPLSQMQVINDNAVATDTTYSSTKIEAKFAEESNVVHKEGAETITGSKTFTANTYIGTSSTKADLNMHGDLNIQGNIFQSGEAYETHAEQVYTKDDYIILRDGATAGLATGDYAGFQVVKYDGVNNGRLVIDNKGEARVGDEGDEQPLLTRNESENMTANALLKWNATESKAETTTDYYNKQQVDDAVVHKTGNETINGVKTFTSGPNIPIVNINNTGDAAIRRNNVNFVRLTNNGSLVLSGNANTMYLRPNGDANTEGSVSIDTEGNVTATKFIGPLEGTATNAVHDGAGNAIVSTYATKADLGDIATLETTEKDSAIGAINEIFNSVKDDVVHNTGDETVAGVKTFTDTIVGTIENATKATQDASGNVITTTYATQATTGQLSDLDTTDKSSLVSAINEVKGAIPGASSLVHTTGNETISGVKTFTSTIVGTINNATNATNATKATQDASGNVITTTYATQATTGKLTDLVTTNKTNLVSAINEVRNAVPDVTNVVHNTGNETVAGVKTFTSDLTTSSTGVNITNTTADVSVKKGGTPFVRLATNGSLVVSGKANTVYFRPNGDSSSVGAATLDVNGNFTATKFTGPLTGNVTGNVSGSSGSCTGNSATATKATQDGSGNVITTTYQKVANLSQTVDDSETEYPSNKAVKTELETKANLSLNNLDNVGADKLNTSKMYTTGAVSEDEQGFEQLKQMKRSTFDLSKFTVVGSPTITDDGVASGFSSSNYISIPNINLGNSFNIYQYVTVASVTQQYLFAIQGNRYLQLQLRSNNKLSLEIGSGGDSWTYTGNGTTSLAVSSSYYLHFYYDNGAYKVDISTDGEVWTNEMTIASASQIVTGTHTLLLCSQRSLGGNFTGSIDLKHFSITVDSKEVFGGNKTGIDIIKPDNYEVVGSPVISEDGIASGFSNNDYINRGLFSAITLQDSFEIYTKAKLDSLTSTTQAFIMGQDPAIYGPKGQPYFGVTLDGKYRYGKFGDDAINSTIDCPLGEWRYYKVTKIKGSYDYNFYYSVDGLNWLPIGSATGNRLINSEAELCFGGNGYSNGNPFSNGAIDLNYCEIYINGNLVWQATLRIPYTKSKTGSKIVDAVYRDRVIDLYEQEGQAGYYTIDEENKNFTLPMGEIYGMKANNTDVVHLTNDETIEGTKTFSTKIVGTIDKAVSDDSGNVITTTYATKTEATKVQSVVSAGNAKYPIHLNNGTAATTNTALIDTSIYANPSTNTIGADIVSVASKVNVAYNANTSSLDFNWV